MIVAESIERIRAAVADARRAGRKPVGLVPTMGALHAGHYSLIDAAVAECGFVVVSLFVNPTQFGPGEDLDSYPRTLEADLAGCQARGVSAVFAPTPKEMYPDGFATTVHVAGLTEGLCGAARPGHFDGVCTVVAKLLSIVAPDAAYFGAKDYQQAAVIRRLVADLDLPVRIAVCPTVREPDGLAMSSRNTRLSPDERRQAVALVESLRLAREMVRRGQRSAAVVAESIRAHLAEKAPLATVDYVEIIDPDALTAVVSIEEPVVAALAARFPSARLIDNMALDPPRGEA